jgi:hypothetical protein
MIRSARIREKNFELSCASGKSLLRFNGVNSSELAPPGCPQNYKIKVLLEK